MGGPDLVRAFYAAHVHPNVLHPLLEAKGKRFVALLENGVVVAAASLQKRPFGFEQVGGVMVAPALRGSGLAWKLLPAAMAEARRAGSRWMVGGVYRRAPDASPFYRALGFRTWIPWIPGASSPWPFGWLARAMAALVRTPAGPDSIRIMGGRVS